MLTSVLSFTVLSSCAVMASLLPRPESQRASIGLAENSCWKAAFCNQVPPSVVVCSSARVGQHPAAPSAALDQVNETPDPATCQCSWRTHQLLTHFVKCETWGFPSSALFTLLLDHFC